MRPVQQEHRGKYLLFVKEVFRAMEVAIKTKIKTFRLKLISNKRNSHTSTLLLRSIPLQNMKEEIKISFSQRSHGCHSSGIHLIIFQRAQKPLLSLISSKTRCPTTSKN